MDLTTSMGKIPGSNDPIFPDLTTNIQSYRMCSNNKRFITGHDLRENAQSRIVVKIYHLKRSLYAK